MAMAMAMVTTTTAMADREVYYEVEHIQQVSFRSKLGVKVISSILRYHLRIPFASHSRNISQLR